MSRAKWVEHLKAFIVLLLIAAGWGHAMHKDSQINDIAADAYFSGYTDARDEIKAGKDALLIGQVCTGWWFGNNPLQQAVTRKQMCGGKS